jgi:hypothetical protein
MDATRHLDRHRHLWDSPAFREMQRHTELHRLVQSTFDSPALRMLRDLPHLSREFQFSSILANPALREWLKTSDERSRAVRDFASAFRPAESVWREFERLSTILNSQTYRVFHEGNERERQVIQQMLALSPTLSPVREFIERAGEQLSATYIGRLLELTRQLVEATDAEDVEEYATRLEKHFREQAAALPPGKVSVEGMLGIALAIILFLIANHISSQSEERLTDRVARAEQNIVASVERLRPREEANKPFYVVTRQTTVVLRPRPKSPVVAEIYPQQKVKVEAEKGPWLYVSFFDLNEGVTKAGWARKKYMKRLPPEAEPILSPAAETPPSVELGEADTSTSTAGEAKETWVQFSESMRVVSYSPDQEPYVAGLRELLKKGARAVPESEEDGTYEILGEGRIYYVTMTPQREFAALLSSWTPDRPPVEVTLPGGA